MILDGPHFWYQVGLHDDHAIMLESMNFPGFFLGVAPADAALSDGSVDQVYLLTLTQPQKGPGEKGEEKDLLENVDPDVYTHTCCTSTHH